MAIPAYIQSLLKGMSWTGGAGSPATVAYTFNSVFFSGTLMNGIQRQAAAQAMQQWSNVANIRFVENNAAPQIAFTQEVLGIFVLGVTKTIFSGSQIVNAEVTLSTLETGFSAGKSGFQTLMHELGHAIGLKHPGFYGSNDTGPFLPVSDDNWDNSVMSYDSGAFTGGGNYPSTPMVYDIAAAQYLYGANTSYNAGNTTYTFNGAKQAMTIWDGGGGDTIDSSAYGGNSVLDLREGANNVSHIGSSQVWVAYNAGIENATGGNGSDTFYGNGLGNTLWGNAGNDTMNGYDGNDFLQGNTGNDTLNGNGGNDTVLGGKDNDVVRGGQGNDFVNGNIGNDQVFGDAGNDTIRGGQNNDQMFGGAGDDIIFGDLGNDTLTGNEGRDTFVFELNSGQDTITDFSLAGGEIMQFSPQIFASQAIALAAVSYSGGNAVIDLGAGNHVTLLGISSGLALDDFSIA